jgi:antitoxin component YwqK of YwqJK toxin-antitoxin module
MKYFFLISVIILGFVSCNNETEKTNNKVEFKVDKRSYSGQIVEFYKNGTRKYLVNYDNGIKDGKYETWFKTGTKKVEGKYQDGKRVGTWNWYDEKGKAYFAVKYDNTELSSL